jgi:copper(I)-binding protein
VAEKIQFHKETEEDGVARMRELRSVEIAPGAKVTFKPGDMHMMMLRLKQPLVEGQIFPLTLDFEKAGKVDVMVSVAGIGAMEHVDMSPTTGGAVTR